MKVFLASLLAAAALASRPDTGFHYLIAEDSVNMREWDFDDATEEAEYTDYDGQLLTLETHQPEDDVMTFCFDVNLDDWDTEAEYQLYGVAWTNGEGYSEDAELNGLIARGTEDSGVWTWVMYDDIATAVAAEADTESDVWSYVDWSPTPFTEYACCCGSDCYGTICAQRATVEDGYFDLPFVSGTEFVAYWSSGAFTGVEYSGAMSLGLALLSAAGAALTLI
jgi:hypothetical protein